MIRTGGMLVFISWKFRQNLAGLSRQFTASANRRSTSRNGVTFWSAHNVSLAAIAADCGQHCSLNRWMQTALTNSKKRNQLFIRTHNEPLSVVAMCVSNPDCSPIRIDEIVSDGLPVLHA